jgi:hypothetical protein
VKYNLTGSITSMKLINLDDLRDVAAMSYVLHQMMHALRRSHLQMDTGDLSRLLLLHKSELSRMKLLHRRPQYRYYVTKASLYRVLRYLKQQFPTFIIYQRDDGRLLVRLYKRWEDHRLPASTAFLQPLSPPFRRDIRPGTTKWFLQQKG